MEHVIQIGINVDDEAIQRAVIDNASKQVTKTLEDSIFRVRYYSGTARQLSEAAEEIITKTLDKYKDEIIEKAAESVANSIKRSKRYRELISELEGNNAD